jgi:hypothetical protein
MLRGAEAELLADRIAGETQQDAAEVAVSHGSVNAKDA